MVGVPHEAFNKVEGY